VSTRRPFRVFFHKSTPSELSEIPFFLIGPGSPGRRSLLFPDSFLHDYGAGCVLCGLSLTRLLSVNMFILPLLYLLGLRPSCLGETQLPLHLAPPLTPRIAPPRVAVLAPLPNRPFASAGL